MRRETGEIGNPIATGLLHLDPNLILTGALQVLELEPASRVLEVGFGHGRTLSRALELASNGLVAGIDVSADMVEAFRIRMHTLIAYTPCTRCISGTTRSFISERSIVL